MRDRIAAEIPRLRRFARGLTRDRMLADDLVQDCLERALTRAHLYDASRSLRAWLLTILRNLYLNKVREEHWRAKQTTLLGTQPETSGQTGAQFDRVLAQQVMMAVHAMQSEHREVLLLVAVEGLSYREAGEVTGVPIGTVMSRLARAREQLRIEIDGGTRPQIRRVK